MVDWANGNFKGYPKPRRSTAESDAFASAVFVADFGRDKTQQG